MTIRFSLPACLAAALALGACKNNEAVEFANATRLGFGAGVDYTETDPDGADVTDATRVYGGVDFGHRLNGNLELGALVGLESADTPGDRTNSGKLGPQMRYYLRETGSVQPWLAAAVGFGGSDAGGDSNGYAFASAGGGISFFASKWVAIETKLYYEHENYDDFDKNGIRLALGISTFF